MCKLKFHKLQNWCEIKWQQRANNKSFNFHQRTNFCILPHIGTTPRIYIYCMQNAPCGMSLRALIKASIGLHPHVVYTILLYTCMELCSKSFYHLSPCCAWLVPTFYLMPTVSWLVTRANVASVFHSMCTSATLFARAIITMFSDLWHFAFWRFFNKYGKIKFILFINFFFFF